MKVIMIANASSTHTVRWANSLQENGIDITLITQHQVREGLNDNIKLIYLPYRGGKGYFLNTFRLKSLVNKIKPDLIHVHFASGYGTLAYLSGLQYVLSVWGSDVYRFPNNNPINKLLLKKILKKATLVLSTSKAMAVETSKYFSGNIEITPFGVDVKKYNLEKNSSTNFRFGLLKVIEERYGVDILIKAFKQFINLNLDSNATLTIAGDGPALAEMKALTDSLELTEKVDFLGWVNNKDTPHFFQNIDVLIVPSREESFGVVAVEGMASNTAVIASNVGGLPEVIEDNVTGLIFDSENVSQLSDLMCVMYNNSKLRDSFIEHGFAKAGNEYNWDLNVKLMMEIYKRNIKKFNE